MPRINSDWVVEYWNELIQEWHPCSPRVDMEMAMKLAKQWDENRSALAYRASNIYTGDVLPAAIL